MTLADRIRNTFRVTEDDETVTEDECDHEWELDAEGWVLNDQVGYAPENGALLFPFSETGPYVCSKCDDRYGTRSLISQARAPWTIIGDHKPRHHMVVIDTDDIEVIEVDSFFDIGWDGDEFLDEHRS